MQRGRALGAAALGVLAALAAGPAAAAPRDTAAARTAAEAAPARPAEAAAVAGFRSARFGMSEAEVRQAIVRDFGLPADAIERTVNPLEKTASLVVTVDEVLPDSGPAQLAYIHGYESKALIQVNIIWGAPARPEADAQSLIATGNILKNYFAQQGFAQDRVMTDVAMEDGSVILFRGADDQGRTILLHLKAAKPAGGDGADAAPLRASSLWLSYIANPVRPDIFRVEQGAF